MKNGSNGEAMPCERMRLAGALLLCAFVACSRSQAPGVGGETLRIAVPQDPKTLNPILASNTVEGFITRFMFEPLISADAHGKPVPILAVAVPSRANGGISSDGRTITYRLRKDARWTDGVPVSAGDVKFSWDAIMSPANNAVSRHGYDDVGGIDTPDARTVVVRLTKPFAPFVNTFFAESDQPYTIVPAHVLARYANVNQIPFNARPTVTDGPFRFEQWVHGDRIVLSANDAFFMGRPHLRVIEIHIVPDENTSVNLLRTHSIDYVYQPSIATYQALSRVPGVRFVWVEANGYEGIGLNMTHAPLNDARVRRAIAYAIDRNRLVDTLTFGQERAATEDLPSWMEGSDPSAPPPYDPAKARALLRSAHVKTPLDLTVVTDTANVTHKREAVELQAMLAAIGIDAEVKTYPGDLLYAPAGAGGILNGGNFDVAIWPWYGGIDPDNSSQFSCANLPPHGYNEARYCSPEMERLQSVALASDDPAVRGAAYRAIEGLVRRDEPVIAFWWQRQQEALSVNLKGFTPNPVVESWNAWQWSL